MIKLPLKPPELGKTGKAAYRFAYNVTWVDHTLLLLCNCFLFIPVGFIVFYVFLKEEEY